MPPSKSSTSNKHDHHHDFHDAASAPWYGSMSYINGHSYQFLVVADMTVPNDAIFTFDAKEVNHLAPASSSSCSWMMATTISDDDLTFGGKPLCMWYEEERQRQSYASYGSTTSGSDHGDDEVEEELRRGRQRDRPRLQETKKQIDNKNSNG